MDINDLKQVSNKYAYDFQQFPKKNLLVTVFLMVQLQ